MEAKWLKREGASELIVFFCGWGFDEHCVARLDANGYDVVVLYDYRDGTFPLEKHLGYERITVVAWSFGVWVAGKAIEDGLVLPHQAFAINGTLKPVDDSEGIPPKIFDSTLAGLSEAAISKFNMRICGGARQMADLKDLMPTRDFNGQYEELALLGKRFAEGCLLNKDSWSKALISTSDLIFPYQNMKNHWGDRATTIDGAHLCFGKVTSWNNLIKLITGLEHE